MPRSQLIIAVYLPTVLLAFGQGLLLATLPLYAASFDTSYLWVSFAVSAAALGTLITDVPAGALLGRIGLRRAMIAGSALVTFGTISVVLMDDYGLFVILRVIAGIGTALWGLSRHALIAETIPPAERGRAISVFGGINRMGVFGGPALGGFIGTAYGLRAPFLFAGLLASVALAVAIFVIPSGVAASSTISPGQRWRVVGSLVRTNGRDLAAASVAQVFAQMIRQGRQFIVPLYGAQHVGLDVAQIGLVMTSAALLDVAMFFPAGVVMDKFGRKVAAVPSFAVMAVGVSLIPLADSFAGLMAAAVIIGFGNGLGSGTMMTLGADLAPKGATGEFLGVWRLIGDTGQVGGPLVVGAMAGVLGLANSAYALAFIGGVAALTLSFLVRETRHTPLEVAA
ncbi:MAG TPA: MFS transporter [Thermomicrobiales bacterium]|nr:MFS transporter [Thermomicrobiales bacterium]